MKLIIKVSNRRPLCFLGILFFFFPIIASPVEPAASGVIIVRRNQTLLLPEANQFLRSFDKTGAAAHTSDGWSLSPLLTARTVSTPNTMHAAARMSLTEMKVKGIVKNETHKWDLAHFERVDVKPPRTRAEAWEQVHRQLKIWQDNGDLLRLGIDYGEPDLILKKQGGDQLSKVPTRKLRSQAVPQANGADLPPDNRPRTVHHGVSASSHWPRISEFGWHLGCDFTQLANARDTVRRDGAWTNKVKVVLLDTGVRTDYASVPEKFNVDQALNLFDDPSDPKGWSLHGTATTSILAGGRVRGDRQQFFPGSPPGPFEDYVGAAPWVEVTTYRIHQSVVHLASSMMAAGITAAATNGADIISISHGGLPLLSWAEAVDNAYEHGTAMFAASGDYLNYILFHTPRRVVYPAAFDRVICVPAATASHKSYGLGNSFWENFILGQMRGNYGPIFEMDNAICGFSPNITWVGAAPDLIDLDGGGTSASTPQVAAAAAIWLQEHRNDGELANNNVWRSHKKVDAVYFALKSTARVDRLKEKPTSLFFGNGTVSANDSLRVPYAADRPSYSPSTVELAALLALLTDWFGPAYFKEGLTETPRDKSFQTEALQVALESKEVQAMLERLQQPQLTSNQQKRVRTIIKQSRAASPSLKAWLADYTSSPQ